MNATFFACRIVLDGASLYCLWFTNGSNGVVAADNRILLWRSEAEARQYARDLAFDLSPDPPAFFDMDRIIALCGSVAELGAVADLDLWNLFSDIASTIGNDRFRDADQEAAETHARLSAFSLSDTIGCKQEQLTLLDRQSIMKVLLLGIEMIRRNSVIGG